MAKRKYRIVNGGILERKEDCKVLCDEAMTYPDLASEYKSKRNCVNICVKAWKLRRIKR